ncbi:serine/threonine protein kinase [Corynebacterium striatum]|uniref:serine/threonine protein kinase n=1 Tax=Corynebacterium striatum TaxID=43770 RepID=UPI000C288ECC|nr:serine/threonine protein kinase [Corynebacterium striatum]ATZ06981.1 serine/threonine protein kinase [Corynebacterium striatum]
MKKLPEFFSTQHQLRQLSVMDESSVSTLFGVVDSSNKPMTVELFEANHRGAVKQASVLADVHHRSIAPLVGTGTTEKGQDFLVRAALSGEPLSTFTGSGLGAQHLTKTEALSVFTPLSEAVDYLLQNNQTGFAMHALHPRRIMVTGSRSNAVLCAAGPGVGNVTAEQVTQRFAELIKSAHPEFKPNSQFNSAGTVIDALRNASTSTGTAAAGAAGAAAAGFASQFASPQAAAPREQTHPQTQPQPAQQAPQQQMPPQYMPQQQPIMQRGQYQQGFQQGQPQGQMQSQPNGAGFAAPVAEKKSGSGKKTGLIALCAALAVVVLAAAGIFFFNQYPGWNDDESNLAEAYPGLLGSRSGTSGYGDTKCHHREPEEGQLAKITCEGDDLSYAVASYESVEARDAILPPDPTELSNGQCTIQSFEAPNAEEPTYYMAVPGTQSAFIIWGTEAENARLKMQLCA